MSIPFILTTQHYSAALYARRVAISVTASLKDSGTWYEKHSATARVEGSRLGITGIGLYVLLPLGTMLAFVGTVFIAGLSSANTGILAIIGACAIVFLILDVLSVNVFVRGLLRRERENTADYVTSTLQPIFMGLMAVQLFFFCYAIMIELTVPSAPGTNLLLVTNSVIGVLIGTADTRDVAYPSFAHCQANVNATYLARYCTGSDNIQLPWQQFGAALHFDCADGGFGIFTSLYGACLSLVGESNVLGPLGDNLFAQLYLWGLVLFRQHVASADPMLALDNYLQKGSYYVIAASISAMVCALTVPVLAAHAFFLLTSADEFATWVAFYARLTGGCALIFSLACMFVDFVVRKFNPDKHKSFFISYKQDDGADGAVGMVYNLLPRQRPLARQAGLRSVCPGHDQRRQEMRRLPGCSFSALPLVVVLLSRAPHGHDGEQAHTGGLQLAQDHCGGRAPAHRAAPGAPPAARRHRVFANP